MRTSALIPHTSRLQQLISAAQNIPEDVTSGNIWNNLDWDPELSEAYPYLRDVGIDCRPLTSPCFADIVSILTDATFGFPYPAGAFHWDDVLQGKIREFQGINPKQRMLRVLTTTLKCSFIVDALDAPELFSK